MFGFEQPEPYKGKQTRRKPTVVKGYAALPGSGPEGETCGSCGHHVIKRLGKKYHKCDLMRLAWTGGAGTDIRVRSPACSKWKAVHTRNKTG